MSLANFETAARNWLVTAVNDPTKEVIFGMQTDANGRTPPQPTEPFVMLRNTAISEIGYPETDPATDASGNRDIYERYQATISCHFVGRGGKALALAAYRALNKNSVRETFEGSDLGVLRATDIVDVPDIQNGQHRDRSQFDLFLDVPDSQTEDVSYIGIVQISSTIENADGTTAVTQSFDVEI